MILDTISFLLVMTSVIIFHEIGHLYYLSKVLNIKAELRFSKGLILVGQPEQYVGHKKEHYKGIYGFGILFGFIPFLFAMLFNAITPYYLIGGIIAYIAGCYWDFRNYWRYGIKGKEWVI